MSCAGVTHRMGRREVLRPARAQRRLPADVPQHKLEVLVFKGFCVSMHVCGRSVPVLEPIVGAVATTDPSVILYMSVVLPV